MVGVASIAASYLKFSAKDEKEVFRPPSRSLWVEDFLKKSNPFWPDHGVASVLVNVGQCGLGSPLAASSQTFTCIFFYGCPRDGDQDLLEFAKGAVVEEGWVYGADLTEQLARLTGQRGDVVKGQLICWPKQLVFQGKLRGADQFWGYHPSSTSQNCVGRTVAWVVCRDGGSKQAYFYYQASSSMSSERSTQPRALVLYYNDVYQFPLPSGHRFPMEKYRVVRERLQQLLTEQAHFYVSPFASREDLCTTHHPEYVKRFLEGTLSEKEIRWIGFPWSQKGVKRALSSTGGTIAAALVAASAEMLERNCGLVPLSTNPQMTGQVAGGTHHAFADRGEGFCVFSDIACAINVVRRDFPALKYFVIVDLDVHQGNGNAVLFQDDPDVFTFSMHCTKNIFSEKQHSDLDVEVPAGTEDEEYLRLLAIYMPVLLLPKPDLIFFQAGVDSSREDRIGKLKLTRDGLRRRNQLVYSAALDAGVRVVVTMGGGYPKTTEPESTSFQEVIGAHQDVYTDAVSAIEQWKSKNQSR
eukprot:gb/GEZN01004143.1/.p1 GENE.gb/GEZN01004143.1/~~gb/GEZN01004143.1/.p1  ORF type:complete len:599 (-),score=70.56 gb/GEZN01004143.1/:218-1792(-)